MVENVSVLRNDNTSSPDEEKHLVCMLKLMNSTSSAEEDVKEEIAELESSLQSELDYKYYVTVRHAKSAVKEHLHMELSVLFQNNSVTDFLMTTVTLWLRNETETASENWSLIGADHQSCCLIQLGWFVFVEHDKAA